MCMIAARLIEDIVSLPTGLERGVLLNGEMALERSTCVLPPLHQAVPIPCSKASRSREPIAGGPFAAPASVQRGR
jgi:hypothetical protein